MKVEDADKLEWLTSYEIGYPLIDGEHRYLFDLVRRASIAIEQHDVTETLSLVGRFVAACQYHFLHEEEVMRDIGFDGIERHVAYHRKLLRYANDLLEGCEVARDIGVMKRHFTALRDCLLDDVISGDREFLPYLNEKGLVKSPARTNPHGDSKR